MALTSVLPRERVTSDLGVGELTFNRWVSHSRPPDLVSMTRADWGERMDGSALRTAWSAKRWKS